MSTAIRSIRFINYNKLGETTKEKYENIFVEICKSQKSLLERMNASGISSEDTDCVIEVGEYISDILQCSRTYCFSHGPDLSADQPDLGEFYFFGQKHRIHWNKELPYNHITIDCKGGKTRLIIDNAPIDYIDHKMIDLIEIYKDSECENCGKKGNLIPIRERSPDRSTIAFCKQCVMRIIQKM